MVDFIQSIQYNSQIVILFIIYVNEEVTMSLSENQIITLNNGCTFVAPNSWKAIKAVNHMKITSPEKDLTLYFADRQITTPNQNIAELAMCAWRQVTPDFNLKISKEIPMPTSSAWEKNIYIQYDMPTSESCCVMAMVRIFNGYT